MGPQAKGLSATNIVRLKESWQQEWKSWSQRSLEGKPIEKTVPLSLELRATLQELSPHLRRLLALLEEVDTSPDETFLDFERRDQEGG